MRTRLPELGDFGMLILTKTSELHADEFASQFAGGYIAQTIKPYLNIQIMVPNYSCSYIVLIHVIFCRFPSQKSQWM